MLEIHQTFIKINSLLRSNKNESQWLIRKSKEKRTEREYYYWKDCLLKISKAIVIRLLMAFLDSLKFLLHKNNLRYVRQNTGLTLPALSTSVICTKININLNYYFHISLWCLKMFYEDLKELHKNFWGTTNKCKCKNFTLFFSLRPGSGREGLKYLSKISSTFKT